MNVELSALLRTLRQSRGLNISDEALFVVKRVRAELLRAEAHLNLGDRSTAHDRLTIAIDYAHQLQAAHFDQRIAKLRAQF